MRSILLATCLMAALLPATVQPVAAEEGAELPAPKISTIMQQQQLRHIKLWFAGRAGNWPLADYEIDALKDGFDELNEQLGGETVAKEVGAQISALEKAIDAKDRTAFTTAFDALTAGCNSCHHALDHAFIVIQRPILLPYSDQLFAAPK